MQPREPPELDLSKHEEDWATRRSNHASEIKVVRRVLLISNFFTLACAAAVPILELVWFLDVYRGTAIRYSAIVAGSALVIFIVGLVGDHWAQIRPQTRGHPPLPVPSHPVATCPRPLASRRPVPGARHIAVAGAPRHAGVHAGRRNHGLRHPPL